MNPIRSGTKAAVGLGLCLALVALFVAVPAQRAEASTLTACVNKKSGVFKIRLGNKAKKKCPKGWKKEIWNDSNSGAPASVYSADGKRVGNFLSFGYLFGSYAVVTVQRNGGQYLYLAGTGEMFSPYGGSSPVFTDSSCTGPAYLSQSSDPPVPLPASELARLKSLISGVARWVFRTQSGLGELGRPKVWTGNRTATYVDVATTVYELNPASGACEADPSPFTGTLFGLKKVATPTPYDFKGPLSVR